MHKIEKNEKTLTEKVFFFQEHGVGFDNIINDLSLIIYNYPKKKYNTNEDAQGEFYLFFLPKLHNMIRNFKDLGIPFEHYFYTTLANNYKNFLKEKCKKKAVNQFFNSPEFCNDMLENNSFCTLPDKERIITENGEYSENLVNQFLNNIPDSVRMIFNINSRNQISKNSLKLRMVYLALRCAILMDSLKIDIIAFITGLERNWIILKIQNILELLKNKEKKINLWRYRRNNIFLKIRLLERRLLSVNNTYKKENIKKQLKRYKYYLYCINNRIASCTVYPSYRQLAKVLNLPKGTVGTGLRWLKEISRKGFK